MYVVANICYCGSKSWSYIVFTTSPLAKSWIRACPVQPRYSNATVVGTMFLLHEDLSTMTGNYLDMSNPSHLMMVADDVAVWQHPNHNYLVVVLFVLCVVVAQSPVKEELQLDTI